MNRLVQWFGVRLLPAALAIALAALAPLAAAAQSPTGGLRGFVRDEGGQPLAGALVTARSTGTGATRSATADETGFYALLGLAPADYQVSARRVGGQPQTRTVRVAVGQVLDIDFNMTQAAVEVSGITVTAPANADVRSSEIATNVSPEQIAALPSPQRNFLDFAALAPGVRLSGDRIDDTRRTISYGAQGAEQINVFVDGATYKNDILRGGVAGQDASRGNPFPMGAIQEYRVLTQNYRAEYQRASSAVITAATRSGTNTWTGNGFFSYQDRSLVDLNQFQRTTAIRDTTFQKPDYTRDLFGASVGGPLMRDRLFVFGSFEYNRQNRTNRVNIVPPAGYPALDSIDWASRNGEFPSPFRQSLFFGKLSYAQSEHASLELSVNSRAEHDIRDFGGLTAYEAATRFQNAVTTATLRHTYAPGGDWLNEATASWQRYHYNPQPATPAAIRRLFGFGCCAVLGSYNTVQDFTQRRISLRNDLTYTGLRSGGNHVIKMGANVDLLHYDIIKRNSETPLFVYELWFDSAKTPERVEFQAGDPNFASNNTQIGAYIQDDWSPTQRLTFNLGLRWDVETGMINRDYVTPQNVVDSLTKYSDSLFLPLDPNRYFSTGSNRSLYLGAIQPRVGMTYQLDRDGRTTVYGGWGLFQDRTLYDQAIEERFAQQHPGYTIHFDSVGGADPNRVDWDPAYLQGRSQLDPLLTGLASNTQEVKLLPNDLRPPMSQQFSLGVRRRLGRWTADVSYTGVRSDNVFTFYWANSNFTCTPRTFACFTTHPVPGFGTILMADNAGKTWYDALNVKLERPFMASERDLSWGAGLAYTYAERQTQGFNDDFSFPNPADYPRQVRNDERHHLVANWILQSNRLWGVQFSGILTYGSGVKLDVGDRFGGTTNPLRPGAFQTPAFTNVDLRLRKELNYSTYRLGIGVDLFNAFGNQNLGCFNTGNPADGAFGTAGCTISDPQRLQVGVDFGF